MQNPASALSLAEIQAIYDTPLISLIHRAAEVHRTHHNPREVQVSTLLSIKTGGCAEDCAYCPQAARYHTDIEKNDLMSLAVVKAAAKSAKASGSSRLCMGAAWRNVKDGKEFDQVLEMVEAVNELDMEVCCTLGMLTENQAKKLANAGLYAYNHNLDSSEDFYKEIISTRGFNDRLETIDNVRKAGVSVCSGGIIGMGESSLDRCQMLHTLASMETPPESLPINALVPVEGTPLEDQQVVSSWEMIRMVATARVVLPNTVIRLSAGRTEMSDEAQALCFLSGASSIFSGDKLLTTPNPGESADQRLFEALGIQPKAPFTERQKPEHSHEVSDEKERVKWSRPGHVIEKNVEYTIGRKK